MSFKWTCRAGAAMALVLAGCGNSSSATTASTSSSASGQPAAAGSASAGTTCKSTGACDGAGTCKGATGSTCAAAGDCASTFCVDTVCCDKACNGKCEACTAAIKGAGADGTCGPVKAGTDPDPAPAGKDCVAPLQCNGMGACKSPTGTTCRSS